MTPKAKNWTIGILSFLGGVIATIVGFVVLTIYVSFIQEKAEEPSDEEIQAAEDAQALEEAMDDMVYPFDMAALGSRRLENMSPDDIPVGSWWTDGDVYFKVLSNTADTLYMVGTDLEDRGLGITFVKHADSTMVTDGASVYAFHNSPVLCHKLRMADGKKVEMIVSFFYEDYTYPQSVLLRYHGRGLEKQQVLQ